MAQQHGYYVIVSHMHGLALDVQGASTNPGTKVIPWEKHVNDNQLWYDDPWNGTIRTKLNGFCLDVEGDQLQVKPYKPGDVNQMWERDSDGYIRNRHDKTKVLDIFGKRTDAGAPIGMYDTNGGVNQLWHFEFIDGSTAPDHRRYFRIVSALNQKVLDIKGGKAEIGAKLIMWTKNEPVSTNQLWYTDFTGCIYSALNGFAMHAKETGKSLKMVPRTKDPNQFWTLADNGKIWNEGGTGECMDIDKGCKENGAKVISYHYSGSPNQQWHFEYI